MPKAATVDVGNKETLCGGSRARCPANCCLHDAGKVDRFAEPLGLHIGPHLLLSLQARTLCMNTVGDPDCIYGKMMKTSISTEPCLVEREKLQNDGMSK